MRGIRGLLLAGVSAVTVAAPAYAVQQPVAGASDSRVRYVVYDPKNVTQIWSTPGAVLLVEFSKSETIDSVSGADVCGGGTQQQQQQKEGKVEEPACGVDAQPRGNFLVMKFRRCMIPEPLFVLTKRTTGDMRSYKFEVRTEPQICGSDAPPSSPVGGGWGIRQANASAGQEPIGQGNLKYISSEALTAQARTPIQYSVAFQYPGDAAEERRAAAKDRNDQYAKGEARRILDNTINIASADPFYGTRNYRYAYRGNPDYAPADGNVWDNGYLTAITYPALHRMPIVLQVNPDGKEAQVNTAIKDNTIIVTGTPKILRVRDGENVVGEIYNIGWTVNGATPDTGTASPAVQRVIKRPRR